MVALARYWHIILGCPVAFARDAVPISVQTVRITGICPEDGLCLRLAGKGFAVERIAFPDIEARVECPWPRRDGGRGR